ncbi:MAG: hypothetical protein KH135_00250 [Firmicutes bacterium]|nr:hypothetical protein [Bacillota bacterium]
MNYPSWVAYLVSPGLFIYLIVLFFLVSAVIILTLKKLKVIKVQETYKKIILPALIVTFLSYVAGTLVLLLTQFLAKFDWINIKLAEPLVINPFTNIYSFLYTLLAFAVSTGLIFYLNKIITMNTIRLSNGKEFRIALLLTIFTAPYIFFIPAQVTKVRPNEIKTQDVSKIEEYKAISLTDTKKLKELVGQLGSANAYKEVKADINNKPTTITITYKDGIKTPDDQVLEKDSAILLYLFPKIERVDFVVDGIYYTFDYNIINTIHQNRLREMSLKELLEYYEM